MSRRAHEAPAWGAATIVRFGLGAVEAAEAIGVSVSFFRMLVTEGRMPAPRLLNSRQVWDVDELRAAFKALPHAPGATPEAEVDTWADVGSSRGSH